jgi:predicted site-specific integrase-resolvase
MALCVIYTRVSTTPQASGDGLIRQLEECIRYARANKLNIAGVYSDVCSGVGKMPNRDIAFRQSVRLKCPIVVEAGCRWSRHRFGEDPIHEANVVYASAAARESHDRLEALVNDFLKAKFTPK